MDERDRDFSPLTNGLIISPAIREFVLDPPSQGSAMTRRGLPTRLAMISESGTQFRAATLGAALARPGAVRRFLGLLGRDTISQ